MTSVLKLSLPVGTIHFANIYTPLQADGAARPMYGFSIDRDYLEGDARFDEMFVKTPGSRDKNAIPVTCKRRPVVNSNNIDALVDLFLVAQSQNQSGDSILLSHDVEIEVEFFDLTAVGRRGLGMSLKSVWVNL